MLVGDAGIEKLSSAHVAVFGLGGVGGMAAELLCRAGIGTLTIVDGDSYHASNRNRQIGALCSTDGKKKAEEMSARLLDINPDLKLHVHAEYLKDQPMIDVLSAAKYDYVVDAIDTLSPKIYLLFHAVRLGLQVVSSMGSGARFDPLQIKTADISETHTCTLAFDLRKRLRRLGLTNGITCVFSTEPHQKSAVVHCEDEKNKKSVIGTISYMPPVFGSVCASIVIRALLGAKEN